MLFRSKHVDAARPGDPRVLTAIVYLNEKWDAARDGGELSIDVDGSARAAKLAPELDRLVVFWSRTAAHEVLPVSRDRYALSMWFKVPRPLV